MCHRLRNLNVGGTPVGGFKTIDVFRCIVQNAFCKTRASVLVVPQPHFEKTSLLDERGQMLLHSPQWRLQVADRAAGRLRTRCATLEKLNAAFCEGLIVEPLLEQLDCRRTC